MDIKPQIFFGEKLGYKICDGKFCIITQNIYLY
jgi:hypothetical protein